MPSNADVHILSSTQLAMNAQVSSPLCNGKHSPLTPQNVLEGQAENWQISMRNEQFAKKLDENDPLKSFRQEFHYPKIGTLPKANKSCTDPESDSVYLCGHSLGLQPKRLRKYIDYWLNDWADLGVYGHVHGENPFAHCDNPCIPTLKKLLGATDNEVGVMNQLTSNIHFMMISFYRPTAQRYKILYEERAFPSDEYAIKSQIRFHGYDPLDAAISFKPRENEACIRTEDILDLLKQQGESIALVFFSSVQYYSGQLFDMKTITAVAQEYGCVVGWDLAHALGNVPMKLHDWNVDFAVFCSYKYLNSGAGCIGGIFVHSNHFDNEYPRFDGWWGNQDKTRFQMKPDIERGIGANGFRVSNPSIHQCAALAASLEIFDEAGIENIRTKSKLLTQYLQYLIETEINSPNNTNTIRLQILTPTDPEQRGAQLSFRAIGIDPSKLFDQLQQFGVCLDLRNDVIRIAPAPLYNSFTDIYRFVSLLKTVQI